MEQNEQERTDGELSLDACLELLSNRQRRTMFRLLQEAEDNCVSVDEILSGIIDDETRATGERPGHDSVAATLYHVHLPKFADADIVTYDTQRLEIRYYGNSTLEDVYSELQTLE